MCEIPETLVADKSFSTIEYGNPTGGIRERGRRRLGKILLCGAPDDLADRAILYSCKPLQALHLWFWKKNLYLLHGSIISMDEMQGQAIY